MPRFMQFSFVQQTNSDDIDYESSNTLFWIKRVLGSTNISSFECVQMMPLDWTVGDPIPDPNAPEVPPEEDPEGNA